MMHAPSPSPPRWSGSRAKLPWPAWDVGAEPGARPAGASPSWRAIEARTMSLSSSSVIERDRIDDADDRRIHRRRLLPERFAGRTPFDHDEHALVDTRADAIDG